MAKIATGTVLYPAKDNKESQHNPGQRPIKWKLDSGEDARTWHYPSEDVYHLPKGTKAQLVDTGKGWSIVEGTPDQQPQRQDAPASTGTGQPAPATTGYSPAVQPLDRVNDPWRRAGILDELEFRGEVMDIALAKAARAMASKVGILDKEGKKLIGNPADLNQAAIAAMANTLMIGLFDNRSYFGGQSQNATHE